MEGRRLRRRLRGTTTNQDEHLREPDTSGVEHQDPVKADGPAGPGQPTKPIAYVRPMHIEAPATAEPEAALAAQRPERRHSRRHRVQRSHPRGGRTERSGQRRTREGRQRTERRSSRHQQAASQEPPEVPQEHFMEMVLDNNDLALDADFEDGLAPYFPFIQITAAPMGTVQELPQPSGHWSLMGRQAATLYPTIAFTPLSGTALHFMQTSFGTHVFGIPEFFTHIGI